MFNYIYKSNFSYFYLNPDQNGNGQTKNSPNQIHPKNQTCDPPKPIKVKTKP